MSISIEAHDRICQDLHQQMRSLIVENERLKAAAQQALGAMRCAVPTGKITLYEWDKAVSDLDAALAEPVQKPVAWQWLDTAHFRKKIPADSTSSEWTPLYTSPPPLTEEEIEKAYREIWRDLPNEFDHTSAGWIEMGIKYAERAHGIGGQP